jgi:hypothetical protein
VSCYFTLIVIYRNMKYPTNSISKNSPWLGLQVVHVPFASTHVKISHLATSLPTSRQQDVFALLVPSCQQVWNNLLTTCNNLVEIIRLVARLFWQVCYMLDITRLLQPCVDNLVTSLLYHGCNKLVSTIL